MTEIKNKSPERLMWFAVLMRAVNDIKNGEKQSWDNSGLRKEEAIADAILFLFNGGAEYVVALLSEEVGLVESLQELALKYMNENNWRDEIERHGFEVDSNGELVNIASRRRRRTGRKHLYLQLELDKRIKGNDNERL